MNWLKKLLGLEKEEVAQEENSTNTTITEKPVITPVSTGDLCEYCQLDIMDTDPIKIVSNKKLHKKCAKKVRKEAKQLLWG